MLSQTPMECALITQNRTDGRSPCNDAVRDGDGYGGVCLGYAMLLAECRAAYSECVVLEGAHRLSAVLLLRKCIHEGRVAEAVYVERRVCAECAAKI